MKADQYGASLLGAIQYVSAARTWKDAVSRRKTEPIQANAASAHTGAASSSGGTSATGPTCFTGTHPPTLTRVMLRSSLLASLGRVLGRRGIDIPLDAVSFADLVDQHTGKPGAVIAVSFSPHCQ